jgi:general secretion pathway protein G
MPSTHIKHALGFLLVPVLDFLFARGVTACYGELANDTRHLITEETARRITQALDTFRVAHHRIPTAVEGLAPLSPDYVDAVPRDAWDRPFVYAPSVDNRWADIISYGADGKPGGRGDAADISATFGSPNLYQHALVDLLARGSFFLVLLAGFLGARRSAWAAGMLAGTAALLGLVLLAVVATVLDASPTGVLTSIVTLGCLTGSIAVLRRTPGAPALTSTAILCAYVLLGKLIAE